MSTFEYLIENTWIDVKADDNTWKVCKVLKVTQSEVELVYDGWNYNAKYQIPSNRLAPFRKHTALYTGPSSHRRNWNFTIEELDFNTQTIEKVLQVGFSGLEARQVIQYFRGTLGIFIENLLEWEYGNDGERVAKVISFFEKVIELTVQYFKEFPKLEVLYDDLIKNPENFMISDKTALSSALYDFIDNIEKLLNLQPRCRKLFNIINPNYPKYNISENLKESQEYSSIFLHLLDYFIGLEGFQSLALLVNQDLYCPITILNKILLHIYKDFINPEKYKEMYTELINLVKLRLERLTEKDVKSFDIDSVKIILNAGLESPSGEFDKFLLKVFLKLVKSPYLEKRIKGLNEVSSYIETIESKALKKEEISAVLGEEEILRDILETRPHIEILKRSYIVLKLISMNKDIKEKECRIILNLINTGNKTEVETGYKILEEICEHLDKEQQILIYRSLSELNIDKINLSFLTAFSLKTFNQFQSILIENFLLNWIKDENEFNRTKEAIECLKRIYSSDEGLQSASEFTQNFPTVLDSLNEIPQMIEIAKEIFLKFDPQILEDYLNTHRIKERLLINMFSYINLTENLPKMKYERKEQLSSRLAFLEFILVATEYKIFLTFEDLSKLWDAFIKNSKDPIENQIFLRHLTCGNKKPLVKDQEGLFKEFFLNDSLFSDKINYREFNAFKLLFLETNSKDCFEMNKSILKGIKNDRIIGLEKLFKIYLNFEEESVRYVKKVMFTIFTSYHNDIFDRISEIFNKHLKIFISLIDIENTNHVDKALEFFTLLLELDKYDQQLQNINAWDGIKYLGLSLPLDVQCRFIRKKISAAFEVPLSQVSFKAGGEITYSAFYDFQEIKLKKDTYLQCIIEPSQLTEIEAKQLLVDSTELTELIFRTLLKIEKYQQKTWNFTKNLPVRQEHIISFRDLTNFSLVPSDPFEFLHCFILFKDLANDEQWLSSFLSSELLTIFLRLFLENRNSISFLVVQDELYVEVLSYSIQSLKINELFFSDILTVLKKCFENHYSLENRLKFFSNLDKIFSSVETREPEIFQKTIGERLNDIFITVLQTLSTLSISSKEYRHLEKTLLHLVPVPLSQDLILIFFQFINSSLPPSKFFWKLLLSVLKHCRPEPSVLSNIYSAFMTIIKSLSEANTTCSHPLRFIFKILKLINKAQTQEHLSPEIFENYLKHFLFGSSFNSSDAVCKSPLTRSAAYRYLISLINNDNCQIVLDWLNRLSVTLAWRSSKNWSLYFNPREKLLKYSGIKNLGNTCYMNSLFQQLYFIQSFSDSLLNFEISAVEVPVFQLKKVFVKLKYFHMPYISCKSFCSYFRDYEDKPINPLEQMDADEFYCRLMDKLENDLKHTEKNNLVQEHFSVCSSIEMISQCGHKSERQESMLNVSLEVKNKKDLLDSLNSLVQGEIMEGENAYFCETCHAKVKSQRRTSFKYLPNFLVFSLRRFEFNYDYMVRVKLDDRFEFPFQLDMKKFSHEFLNNEGLAGDDYYEYVLRGVVLHYGKAERGHYFSYIKIGEDWMEFNDTSVSFIKEELVKEKGFGSNGNGMVSSAYLLVYERKTKFEIFQKNREKNRIEMEDKVDGNYVQDKNINAYYKKIVLSADYLKFQLALSKIFNEATYTLDYFLTVLVRVERSYIEKARLFEFILKKLDHKLAYRVIEILCSESGIIEFFLTCPSYLSRKMVCLIMKKSIDCLNEENVCKAFEYFLVKFADLNKYSISNEYFEAILHFCKTVPEKAKELGVFDNTLKLLTRVEFILPLSPLNTALIGYSKPYKHFITPTNDIINTSKSSAFDILSLFLSELSEESVLCLRQQDIRDKLQNSYINTRESIRSFTTFYANLYQDDLEESVNYVLFLINRAQDVQHDYKYFLLSLVYFFVNTHKLRYDILSNILDYYISVIPNNSPRDFETFINYFFKLLDNINLSQFSHILSQEKIENLKSISSNFSYFVYQGVTLPNEAVKVIHQRLLDFPKIEVPLNNDYGLPESQLVVNREISVFDSGRKQWFDGKILKIIENSLLLIEYNSGSSVCYTLKLVTSEDIYPKS